MTQPLEIPEGHYANLNLARATPDQKDRDPC